MADVKPLKQGSTGVGDFASGDTVPVANGGTGVTTVAGIRSAIGQAWVKIEETTFSSSASYIRTGLSGYRQLRISGTMSPATDNVSLNMNYSTNNGSSYDTGSNYRQASTLAYSVGTANYNATTTYVLILNVIDNASGDGASFTIHIFDWNQAKRSRAVIFGGAARDGGGEQGLCTSMTHLGTTARDAFRIQFDSGNIALGHILVEGLV